MSDTETLSAEDKAYFDTRGETVAAPPADEPAIVADEPEDEPIVDDEPTDTVDEPAADEPADSDKPTGQSKVPLAALTKERNERKAIAARLAETERKAAILEDRWNQILQQQEKANQPQAETATKPAKPDTKADPLGAVDYVLERIVAEDERRENEARQTKEQAAQTEAWNKTLNVARTQYEAAASADENFEPTYTALRANIGQEFMELYGLSEAEARAQVDNYEAQQIAYAVDRGIDVATHMRKLAKTRNITVAPKTAPPAGETLDKLAEGVNGSTSLSAAGGGRVASTNAQSIADMSPSDFEAWLSKNGTDKFRKLAGG